LQPARKKVLPATCGGGQGKPGCSGPSAEHPGYFFACEAVLAAIRGGRLGSIGSVTAKWLVAGGKLNRVEGLRLNILAIINIKFQIKAAGHQ